jgi:hypothetical protein
LAICASVFATGFVSAASTCENFKVTLKNNLHEKLLINSVKLKNGNIQPSILELDEHGTQTFTVNQASEDQPMIGEFVLHTISLPSKKITIRYTLDSKVGLCEHTDKSPAGEISIEKTRKFGEVLYTIE